MNLQQFAVSHGFPISTSARLVREAVVAEPTGPPDPDGFYEIESLGVAYRRAGKRHSYRVDVPDRLARHLVRVGGAHLIPRGSLELLAIVARTFHEAVYERHQFFRITCNGERYLPEDAYWATVRHVLDLVAEVGR